jgi:hypothetical protein
MIAEVLAPFIFQQERSVNGRIYRFPVHAVSSKVKEGSIAPIARVKAHTTLEEDFSVPTLTKSRVIENLFASNLFTKGQASHIIETLFDSHYRGWRTARSHYEGRNSSAATNLSEQR